MPRANKGEEMINVCGKGKVQGQPYKAREISALGRLKRKATSSQRISFPARQEIVGGILVTSKDVGS